MRILFLENIAHMYSFWTKDSTNSILEILCQNKELTVQQIFSLLSNTYKIDISLAQLYKILAKLEKEQMIIKQYNVISLNSLWIKKISDFIEKAKKIYFQDNIAFSQLQEWQRREFSADNLLDLDAIRNNISTQLQLQNDGQETAFYHSHPYFILGNFASRSSLIENIINSQQKLYISYGNESCLDNYGVQLARLQWAQCSCSTKTPFLREWYNLHIIGDYLLELVFSDTVTQHFKVFFDNVQSVSEFNNELYKQIFSMKWRFQFSIQRNKKQAHNAREEIKKLQWLQEGVVY